MTEKISVSEVVKEVFDKLPKDTEFGGLELKKWCVRLAPEFKFKYEDTFMRLLRKYRRTEFICIDRMKSKYRKIA